MPSYTSKVTPIDGHRRYEPEEIEAILTSEDLPNVARQQRRTYNAVYGIRRKLSASLQARQCCPAFLPDTGVPYVVRMTRILREIGAP